MRNEYKHRKQNIFDRIEMFVIYPEALKQEINQDVVALLWLTCHLAWQGTSGDARLSVGALGLWVVILPSISFVVALSVTQSVYIKRNA